MVQNSNDSENLQNVPKEFDNLQHFMYITLLVKDHLVNWQMYFQLH